MPTVRYHSLNGRVVSTTVQGGYRTSLMPDALGSVARTLNEAGGGRTTRYAGYGSPLYSAGGWDMPRNSYAGRWGYRRTDLRHAEQYVRARHLSTGAGRWSTVDPLWPGERAYGYAGGRPTDVADPSGMGPPSFFSPVPFYPGFLDPKHRHKRSNPSPSRPNADSIVNALQGIVDVTSTLAVEALGVAVGEFANATAELLDMPGLLLGHDSALRFPRATNMLKHFLGASGAAVTLPSSDVLDLISDSSNARASFKALTYWAMRHADKSCRDANFHSKPNGNYVPGEENLDWFLTLRTFDTWIKASVRYDGRRYLGRFQFVVFDVYDWHPERGWVHRKMRGIEGVGLANEFEIVGRLNYTIGWTRGKVEAAYRTFSKGNGPVGYFSG